MNEYDTLMALHDEWLRENRGMRVGDRQLFRRAVYDKNPVLYRNLMQDPTILAHCPIFIQHDWCGIRPKPIGHKTLERHMSALGETFLAEARAGSFGTLSEFVEYVLTICSSERELKEYLQDNQLSAG